MGNGHTGVVDEDIEVFVVGFDLLESLLNSLITGEIDLDKLNTVGHTGAFHLQGLNRDLALLEKTAADKNDVGLDRPCERRFRSLSAKQQPRLQCLRSHWTPLSYRIPQHTLSSVKQRR